MLRLKFFALLALPVTSQDDDAVKAYALEAEGYPYSAQLLRHYVYEGPPHNDTEVLLSLLKPFYREYVPADQDAAEGPVKSLRWLQYFELIHFSHGLYY